MDWYGKELASISKYCESNYYKYNDQGIRTQKTTGTCSGSKTTKYTLSGNLVIMESWGTSVNQKIYYTYDVDGSLISFKYNNNEYFYIRNLQGDIIKIIDISGNVLVTYSYDAFGNTLNTSDTSGISLSTINPYRYRGYRYDLETGFYYLQSRYYNPQIGRFISPDSINYLNPMSNSGENLYTYTANNPVNLIDPDGNFALSIFITSVVVGALIGAGLGWYTAVQNDSDILTGIIAGALLGASVGAVIGLGGVYLASGVSSLISKGITDMVSMAFFGGEIGSLQSYALAFSLGGLTGGFLDKLGKATTFGQRVFQFGIKFISDVTVRPALSQGIDIGLGKQKTWNWNQYGYDVASRGLTYFIPGKYKTNTVFGEVSISPFKAFGRGIARGMYPNLAERFIW